MGEKAKPDFSGYATKAGLKCSDGRTITPEAFKHQDASTVPLVWQHTHSEPANILGHVVLENRADGVYAYGYFNDTAPAKNARTLVQHGDIKSLSIYANQLTEKAKQVLHGFIREVSLVLSGANPGALIDNITLAHGDGDMVTLEDEAIIYTGLELKHDSDGDETNGSDSSNDEGNAEEDNSNDAGERTVQEVYDSMDDHQKAVVHYMVGTALEGDSEDNASHSSDDKSGKKELVHDDNEKEGRRMTRNVFEQTGEKKEEKHTLTHDAMKGIFQDAQRIGSLKQAVEAYALKHGIENIDVLFPEVRTVTDTPEFDSRRVEWVKGVLNGTRKSPFTRIKSLVADLTFEEARAKGYIKGNLKKEEFISASKRITTPTTIYKKQRLDRDDILDITDFNVVTWLQGEMRLMLDEELARAVLVGDGRDAADEDHILDPVGAPQGAGIRSIMNDDDLYAATVNVNLGDANSSPTELVDEIIRSMRLYKGSGSPTFYTTLPVITTMLLVRDTLGRRIYGTVNDIASEMGVSSIVACQALEDVPELLGIIVNLTDYTIGTDAGGDVNFFDFFDIDYNQYKYLLETRVSGALTKIRSALVLMSVAGTDVLVKPNAPSFDGTTVTINGTTGAVYHNGNDNSVMADNSTAAVPSGQSLRVYAVPASGHYFENNVDDEWTFTNEN
jgi:Caudovirus prohead serine protease